ncbi:hypothetical protein COLO4_11389 [Corchorus olitorius]|uniref:Sulfotransferase n=1 Tax=Corchorus olitorius TaxID=93759 RepID=A0A1R3K4Q1_9ROSI|nr:hypothetical protein COLO4_11389 [Corchorus olitorius]
MVCGAVYICIICLKQTSSVTKIKFHNIQVIERPSADHSNIVTKLEAQVHYPKPETFSRGECSQNPVRFFAILSMPRSGSGWFETLLNSHINVSSNGEIFSATRRKNLSTIVQTLDKVYNLDWFSSASKNECSAAVGFKWMLNQGLLKHHREIVEYFNRRSVSAIFLFRRNLLRRMVSVLANSHDRNYAKLLNGTHKSHVHSQEEAKALSSYKPIIKSTSLISDLKEVEMTVLKALEYFNSTRHMVVFYEDLVTNHTKLKDVQDFLGLPQMELTSRQVKIHKGSLSDFVKNWDDVNKILHGTEYESFLRADY